MTDKKAFNKSITTYHGALPEVPSWERQQPAVYTGRRETPLPGSKESDVTIPGLQALFVSVAIGQAVGIIAALVTLGFRWPWWLPVCAWLLTTSLLLAERTTRNIKARQELQWMLEEITRTDLDQDGHVGEPPTLTVEVVDRVAKKSLYLDLGIPAEKAAIFARSVLNGRGLSVSEWTGKAGLLSRSEFETMRGKLLEAGLIRWVNPAARQQGLELTRAGCAVFEKLANYPPTVDGDVVFR